MSESDYVAVTFTFRGLQPEFTEEIDREDWEAMDDQERAKFALDLAFGRGLEINWTED